MTPPPPATRPYQLCTLCIMDTSDPGFEFDAQGVCNHCHKYDVRARDELLDGDAARRELDRVVTRIKEEGRGKPYDCIIGVSGGTDSTTVAYHVKKVGLRPLAVHLDNGWDAGLAVTNIERTLNELEIDLQTHVLDWEEFRDLQLAFLRASVPNVEIPTDHAIQALMYQAAVKHRIRFVVSGGNLVTEGVMPRAWGHLNRDLLHLQAIHRRFGKRRLSTYPTMPLHRWANYVLVKRIKYWKILDVIGYHRADSEAMLEREIGWKPYGYKHYESVFTRFFQGYILPEKFGFDKRRAHLSTLILSGQMDRSDALAEMETPPYTPELLAEDRAFVVKKFGMADEEFDAIIRQPPRRHAEYPNMLWLFDRMKRVYSFARRRAIRV